ncbi:polyketide synthetase [Tilletia horrida]|uniref:Polyketide synthetase n=1 Tax=Tilletia horrida TaxID=155126 RepID=A0AAN6GVU4_9BASI|nr:polyketide synthetase [Tilletia horrida]
MSGHYSEKDSLALARHPLAFLNKAPLLLLLGDCTALNSPVWVHVRRAASRSAKVQAFLRCAFSALKTLHARTIAEGNSELEAPLTLAEALDVSTAGPAKVSKVYQSSYDVIAKVSTLIYAGPSTWERAQAFGCTATLSSGPSGDLIQALIENTTSLQALIAGGVDAVCLAFHVALANKTVSSTKTAPRQGMTVRPFSQVHLDAIQAELEASFGSVLLRDDGCLLVTGAIQDLQSFQSRLHEDGRGFAWLIGSSTVPATVPAKDDVPGLSEKTISIIAETQPSLFSSVLLPVAGKDKDPATGSTSLQTLVTQCIQSEIDNLDPLHKSAKTLEARIARLPALAERKVILSTIGMTETDLAAAVCKLKTVVSEVEVEPLDALHPLLAEPTSRPNTLSAIRGTPAGEIAIVGMSCQVPGAEGIEQFWNALESGLDACEMIPERLFRVKDYHSSSYRDRNTMRAQHMNPLARPDIFDAELFGITPEFAKVMDPQQRLSLMVVYEALQHAHYAPNASRSWNPSSIGTFIGICSDDYRENVSLNIKPGFSEGTFRAQIANRMSKYFGWNGPSVTLDTACSSALVAIESACSFLAAGKCNAAVAGGVNVLTQPQIFVGLDRGFFLNSTGQCITFDDTGSGYSRADAVSYVVLKRMADAVRDGDNIIGSIRAASTNHSGEAISITHPHAPTQRRLYEAGMLAAGLRPAEITYIECHGTGTQAGDGQEMDGIKSVFNKSREEYDPVILGSAKANVGHSESASGATSLVKTLLAFENQRIPKHIGIRTKINQGFGDISGINIPVNGAEFVSKPGRARTALVNNFSAAGGNSSLVLHEGPGTANRYTPLKVKEGSTNIFVLSAATARSLLENAEAIQELISSGKATSVAELCYNTGRRLHHAYRIAGTVSSLEDISKLLKTAAATQEGPAPATHPRPVGWVFSGQGSQYINMGRELYETSTSFKASMDYCNAIAKSQGFTDILAAIYPKGDPETAEQPTPAEFQLGIFALEYSLAQLWSSWGVRPDVVGGHSLGEYTALTVAGVLELADAIFLTGTRATLMIQYCVPNSSGMAAIKADVAAIEKLCKDHNVPDVEIACINSPTDTVVAAPLDSITKLIEACAATQTKYLQLRVPYAFHSRAVDSLKDAYAAVANVRFSAPKIPIMSNVLGRIVQPGETGAFNKESLVTHMRATVRFGPALQDLMGTRTDLVNWLELGPHPTTLPMLKSGFAAMTHLSEAPTLLPSVRNGMSPREVMLNSLSTLYLRGLDIAWEKVHESLGSVTNLIKLPTYKFELKQYWTAFRDRNMRDHLVVKDKLSAVSKKKSIDSDASPLKSTQPNLPPFQHAFPLRALKIATDDDPLSVFELDSSTEPAESIIMGHLIRGRGMAPATLFSELAIAIGDYLSKHEEPSHAGSDTIVQVHHLSMFTPLLKLAGEKTIIYLRVYGSIYGKPSLEFFSRRPGLDHETQHASCQLSLTTAGSLGEDWTPVEHLVNARMDSLRHSATDVLDRAMAYRLFESIVHYSEPYQGMRKVYMTEDGSEALAECRLSELAPKGAYLCHPILQDSLGQLSGFIANVGIASDGNVYIANGIGSVRWAPSMAEADSNRRFLSYCKMIGREKGLVVGDIYIVDEATGELTGLFRDVKFQCIKASLLDRMMAQHIANQTPEKAAKVNGTKTPAIGKVTAPVNKAIAASATQPPSAEKKTVTSVPKPVSLSKGTKGGAPILLFPDGSGAAAVYRHLPVSMDSAVLAFSSPFLQKLNEWTGGLEDMFSAYFAAVKQQQPSGPYRLGGWSLGGICAYEVARRLMLEGETVERLYLIDTPLPDKVRPLPQQTQTDLFSRMKKEAGAGGVPNKCIELHFRACINKTVGFSASALPSTGARDLTVSIINAQERSKFPDIMSDSVDDWRKMLGQTAKVEIHKLDADHVSIVQPPTVHELAKLLV